MDKDKLRSIGFLKKKGKSEKVPVTNENTGKVEGYHVKHWDGRQDAHITPQAVVGGSKVEEGE